MLKQSNILSMPENIDAPLWRYMSFEKLESLLKESAMYFRRADLFEGPLEGKHSAATLKNRPSFFEGAKESWIYKTMPMFDARTRKCVYVSCWHNNDNESPYMWEKYTKENKGVVIKSSLNRIRRAILDREREFLINPVRYIDFENDQTFDANGFYVFFAKEKSYLDEREFRFAFIQDFERIGDADFDTLTLEEGIFIPVNNRMLIENIIINPFAHDEDIQNVQSLLSEYRMRDKFRPSAFLS